MHIVTQIPKDPDVFLLVVLWKTRSRQTVKLTLSSSGQSPREPIYKLISRLRPNRPHISSDIRNFKEPIRQKTTSSANFAWRARSPFSDHVRFRLPEPWWFVRSSASRCSVCRFGEAVFTDQFGEPQEAF
ncbi:MAG: hypothetical protein PF443_12440 [Allgaiera sp.]|nr:hypothetical protein [Allgaiera sp.]